MDHPSTLMPAFGGHIFEGAVAFVAVKNRAAIPGDEEIDETVVIKVRRNRRRAINVCRDACLVGDIGEGAVAVVAVEMVVRWPRR
jgi:hypothetical protein